MSEDDWIDVLFDADESIEVIVALNALFDRLHDAVGRWEP